VFSWQILLEVLKRRLGDMLNQNINKLRLQVNCLYILLEASAKEYPAPWIGSGKTIGRNKDGTFASDNTGNAKTTLAKEPISPENLNKEDAEEEEQSNPKKEVETPISEEAETFSKALKQLEKEQVQGVKQEVLDRATKNLSDLVKKRKEYAGELADLMLGDYAKDARKELSKIAKPISTDLSEAVEEDPFSTFGKDIQRLREEADAGNAAALVKDLPKIAQYSISQYEKKTKELRNATGDNAELMQAAGKAAALAVPAAIFFAATLGPIAVVPAITLAATHSGFAAGLSGIVATAAAWKLKDKALNESLDILEVNNPLTRTGAKIVAHGGLLPPDPGISDFFNYAVHGLSGLALFNSTNSSIGRRILPGKNLSGKTDKEVQESQRIKKETENKLKMIAEESEKANKQLEETLAVLKSLQ
jgi:hypothetical protein